MSSFNKTRALSSFGAVVFAVLVGSAVQMGCQNHGGQSQAKGGPSASASASGSAGVLAGPCGEFVKQVCEKAGETSQGCQTLTAAADLLSPATCTAAKKDVAITLKKLADQHKVCDDMVVKLCAEIGKDTETCKMVETQTKNFPPAKCTQMMTHFNEVVADLKKMEAQNAPLKPEVLATLAAADAPSFGPASAKVTIVEFSDFQCPYCSRAADVADKIKAKYSDRVRFVFRQFPLGFHANANLAAQAALAANAQGKFWEFHDKLFKNQQALTRPELEKYAKEVGLDVTKFKKALDDKEFSAKVDSDTKLGSDVAVNGTPTLFLNGKRVPDPTNFEAVSKLIEDGLKG